MKSHPWALLSAGVLMGLAAGSAQATPSGVTGRSGKQNGSTCVQCHGVFTRETQLGLTVENLDGTLAAQPLQPQQTYQLVITARRVQAGNQSPPFLAGFDLATGVAGRPSTTGLLEIPAAEAAWEKVVAGEATHVMKRPSTAINGLQTVTWRVLWKPPALPAGSPGTVKVFAAARRTVGGDVRALSAVSNGANAANAPECGVGGAPASVCGVTVAVVPSNCVDADGDGYLALAGCPFTDPAQGGGDCNDSDATVFPGAPELCNNRDDNCDGQRDEGTSLRPFYDDVDGDGWGSSQRTPVTACDVNGALQLGAVNPVLVGFDCDDANPDVNPAEPEVCDGVDQNCNGTADEGLLYMGLPKGSPCDPPDDVDICMRGRVACLSLTELECAGDVATPELCDGANHDDNCDGLPDEAVWTTLGMPCGAGVGCNQGLWVCSADQLGVACEVPPQDHEICGNHRDDDCDGMVDETDEVIWQGLAFGEPCDSVADADLCKNGRVSCINQRAGCAGDFPTPEWCGDGLDNDCDGATDEADCVPRPGDGGHLGDAAGRDAAHADAAVVTWADAAVQEDPDAGSGEAPSAPGRCGCADGDAGGTPWAWLLAGVVWRRQRSGKTVTHAA